jgi:uncharacterized repeat protein (TIGR01451 family)
MRQRSLVGVGAAVVAVIAFTVLGAAAVTGEAATTQQVTVSITCQPATAQPGRTVGCTVTVTNLGGNNVTRVVVKDDAPGGTFKSTDEPSVCTGLETSTLTCSISKLTAVGTPGSTFTETHELQTASSPGTFRQTISGQYSSPTGNNRGSVAIGPVTKDTTLDPSADYDGRFANDDGDNVQTAGELSGTNPYVTSATVNGLPFEVGLEVREHTPGSGDLINCSPPAQGGCLGNQVLEFSITELVDDLPDTYTLKVQVAGEFVLNTKVEDLIVRHDGVPVPYDPAGDPTTEVFIFSRTKDPSTKDVTFIIKGPGTGNGGWGVGRPG